MKTTLLIVILFLSACSTKTPPNLWQYQANFAYKNFERYYLEDKLDLASIELSRARKSAKQSANLTTLAHIELSHCALHVALREKF